MAQKGISAPIAVIIALILMLSIGMLVQSVFLAAKGSAEGGIGDTSEQTQNEAEATKDSLIDYVQKKIEEGISLNMGLGGGGFGDGGGSATSDFGCG